MTPTGERIIKQWGGLVLRVYLDSSHHETAGWGHLLTDPEVASLPVGTPITMGRAEAWFANDSAWVDTAIKYFVGAPLNENQLAALESLVYNNGARVLSGWAPKLMAAIARQDWPAAAHEFLDICHETDKRTGKRQINPGLQNRRKAESALFLTPVGPEPIDPEQVLFSVGLSLHDIVRAREDSWLSDRNTETADTEPAPPPEFLPEDA